MNEIDLWHLEQCGFIKSLASLVKGLKKVMHKPLHH